MARRRQTSSVRKARWVLLSVLLFVTVVLGGLYLFGRAGRVQDEGNRSSIWRDLAADEAETLILTGEGFDYEITVSNQRIARIRAEKILSESQNEVTLEGVGPIEFYREDGDTVFLESDTATYNFETQDAVLRGDVRIWGPNNLSLESQHMTMDYKQRLVTSPASVRFGMAGEFQGTARRFRANLESNLFVFYQQVAVWSAPDENGRVATLEARELRYERDNALLRASGQTRLLSGGSSLEAHRLSVFLTEDERAAKFVQARWNVRLEHLDESFPGSTQTLKGRGDMLSIRMDPDREEPEEAELDGGGSLAELRVADETGLTRQFRSAVLRADFARGVLSRVNMPRPVQISEYLTFRPELITRASCAARGFMDFDEAGDLAQAELIEDVEFLQPGFLANGDTLRVDEAEATATLVGSPATMTGDQGDLSAPIIVQHRDAGEIRALDGVNARFTRQRGGQSVSLAGGEGPLQVSSKEAEYSESTGLFSFVGDVRAWQGDSFLTAAQITADQAADRLTGIGGIRSTLRPAPDPDDPAPPGEGSEEPIQISSNTLEYEGGARLVRYLGNARVFRGGRTLTCRDVEVELEEGGGARRMTCEGTAVLHDPMAGHQVTGDRALYEVGSRDVTITGEPAIMRGKSGERVEGHRLVYNLDRGRARIEIVERPPADPAETPPGDGGPPEPRPEPSEGGS